MSVQPFNTTSGVGKKAVHVKWAGKTIALGTFPAGEADEKCARAKALTRAWRSTMRPKPTREWVMVELERLGVRVVSGRLGRKIGEDGDEVASPMPEPKKNNMNAMPQQPQPPMPDAGAMSGMNNMNNMPAQRNNSLGWGMDADLNNLMARRNSSLGLSMMSDTLGRRGSLGSLGPMAGFDNEPAIPPHRPLVGGGAAAAYEAARHDHFTQRSAEQQRRASSLGLGSLANGSLGGMGMAVNPNQHYEMLKLHHMNLLNEIQETTLMMNLYQQQQLQQQQQQLEQQAGSSDMMRGSTDQMGGMFPGQNSSSNSGLDQMFGAAQLHRSSLGLGGSQLGNSNFNEQQFQMMQQLNGFNGTGSMTNNNNNLMGNNSMNKNSVMGMNGGGGGNMGPGLLNSGSLGGIAGGGVVGGRNGMNNMNGNSASSSVVVTDDHPGAMHNGLKGQPDMSNQVAQLKEDIARREKMDSAVKQQSGESSKANEETTPVKAEQSGTNKRPAVVTEDGKGDSANKRAKLDVEKSGDEKSAKVKEAGDS